MLTIQVATRALTYMERPTPLLAVTPSRKTRGGCRALLTFYSRYGVRLYLPHKAYSDNIYIAHTWKWKKGKPVFSLILN